MIKKIILFSFLILFPVRANAALTDNLISYWSFNSNANDSLTANNGTFQGNATTAPGFISNAMTLDGSGDYMTASGTGSLVLGGGDFTISCWIKPNTFPSYGAIFGKADNGASVREYSFFFPDGANYYISFGNSSAATGSLSSSFTTATWQYFVVTRSGSNVTIYRNGSSIATATQASTTTNTDTFKIGYSDAGGTYFDGLVDEFGIWGRALSVSEITQLYNSGAGLAYPFTVQSDSRSTFY